MDCDGKITVRVPVTNTGKRSGAEVVQLYVSDSKSSLPRPVKELKNFRKVYLEPDGTAEVVFEITGDDLKFFDAEKHSWISEPGEFEALIGSSSSDIRSKVKFTLTKGSEAMAGL